MARAEVDASAVLPYLDRLEALVERLEAAADRLDSVAPGAVAEAMTEASRRYFGVASEEKAPSPAGIRKETIQAGGNG